MTYPRKTEQIDQEPALDGFSVLRTSVSVETLPSAEVVRSHEHVKEVEREFKAIRDRLLGIRPIADRLADRFKTHMLLCMLVYCLT